jgi:HK97 family phage portal protein
MGILETIRGTLQRFRPSNASLDTANLTPKEFADLLDSYGMSSASGILVTPATAAKCIPVAAACALVAGGIVSMPLRLVRREVVDGRFVQYPADDHDYFWLLNESPNEDYPAAVLWQRVAWDLKLRAESFVMIVRSSGGRDIMVKELSHVPHECVVVDRQWSAAKRRMQIVRYIVTIEGRTVVLVPADMLHFRGELAQGDPPRSAELESAKEAVGLTLAIEQYCGRFFTNGGTPRTVIQYPAGVKLTKDQQDLLREAWVRRYGGVQNSHLPLVLADGGTISRLSATAVESQMLEQRKFQVIEIARAFRVPPFMIGETEKTSSWGSGIEQMSKGFIRYTLGPLITSIEQELNRKLFGIARYFVDFDEEALDKGDMKSLGDWFRQAIGGSQGPGFMTVNEVRRRLNMPPIDGGDELFEQSTPGDSQDAQATSADPVSPAGDPESADAATA